MRAGVDEFLLGLAGISATLIGTFIVGVFFYIDSDLHRRRSASEAEDRYFRSGMRWIFTAYSLPLLAPLALVALEPVWGALVFIALAAMLVMASIDTGRRIVKVGASKAIAVNEWLTSAAVAVALVLPWVLGGWVPPASAFIPSLLLVLASGFASTAALVVAEFDATMVVTPDPGSTESGGAEHRPRPSGER